MRGVRPARVGEYSCRYQVHGGTDRAGSMMYDTQRIWVGVMMVIGVLELVFASSFSAFVSIWGRRTVFSTFAGRSERPRWDTAI